MIQYCVTIASSNDVGHVIEIHFDGLETLFGATRVVHSFKPKKGYRAFDWSIRKVEGLV